MMSAVVVANTSKIGSEQLAQNTAERLKTLMKYLEQKSMLTQTPMGIVFSANEYKFVKFDAENDKWKVIQNNNLLSAQSIGNKLHFEINEKQDESSPQFIVNADGLVSNLAMIIADQDKSILNITNDKDGHLAIESYS